MPAVDAHVHVWSGDRKRYPRVPGERDYPPAQFTPEDLFRHSIPAGVSRVVLIQMSFYRSDHTYMLECMRRHRGIFSGVGIVDPSAPAPHMRMKALAREGVRGFRITPGDSARTWLDGEGMHRMWKTAGEKRLSMCPLVGPEALAGIDRMCAKHPETSVVIDHLARIGVDGAIRDADTKALCSLAKHPQVKVKLSAFYALGQKRAPYTDLLPLIRQVYDVYGSKRLMWASDCPFQVSDGHTYAASISLIRQECPFFSAEDREWILGRTASTVFF